jgi:predicted Fe-Mo cluster-binding NifX family protein
MSVGLDAEVDPRFGRCQCFAVIDSETLKFENLSSASAVKSLDEQLKEVKKLLDKK